MPIFAERVNAAQQALDAGNHDHASLIISSALVEARKLVSSGDAEAFAWVLLLTREIEVLLGERLPAEERARRWEWTRLHARRLDVPIAELTAALSLVELNFRADSLVLLGLAQSAFALVPRCAGTILEGHGARVGAPDREEVYAPLAEVAANLFYEEEKYAETVVIAGGLVELLPDQPSGWFLLGYASLRAHDYERAAAALRQVTRLTPGRAGPFTGLARALQGCGRLAEAVEAIGHAIELDPHPAHHYGRAQLLIQSGRLAEALADLDQVVGHPGDLGDIAAMSRLHVLADLGRTADAEENAVRLTETGDRPTVGSAHRFLGRLRYEAGDYAAAAAHFTAQLELGLGREEALLDRARARMSLGQLDNAVADLIEAGPAHAVGALTELTHVHPEFVAGRKALGYALLATGHPERAAAALRQLPADAEVLTWLGMALVPTDVVAAVRQLVRAVSLGAERLLLRWLVERACARPDVFAELQLIRVLPELDDPFARIRTGGRQQLVAARTALAESNLPVLVGQVDLLLAEWHLRLGEVRPALDHIDAAEDAMTTVGVLPDGPFPGLDRFTDRALEAFRETVELLRAKAVRYSADEERVSVTVAHALTSPPVDEQHVLRAEELMRAGSPREALTSYLAALEIDEQPQVFELAVEAALAADDPVAALELVRRAKGVSAVAGPGVVVADYFVTDERTMLFVVTQHEVRPYVLDTGGAEIAEAVRYFFGVVREIVPDELDDFVDSLVEPIAAHCDPDDVVLLVPHGPLHDVPLWVGEHPVCRQTGAADELQTLWRVDELPATLLVDHFRCRIAAGAGAAKALRDSQVWLSGLTAREVVAMAPSAVDRAVVLAFAGDLTAALEECPDDRLRHLLTLKAEAPPPVDYEARPYAHPAHWAAFVLVGSWR